MSTKIKEVISNIVITEKNEKRCLTTGIPDCLGPKGHFQIKLPLMLMVKYFYRTKIEISDTNNK